MTNLPCGGRSRLQAVWCVACGPVAPVVLLTLLEVEGPDTVSGSGLDSSWYVARHSREIEEVVTQVGNAAGRDRAVSRSVTSGPSAGRPFPR